MTLQEMTLEFFEREYYEQGKSIRRIAREAGIIYSRVMRRAKDLGIQVTKVNRGLRTDITRALLDDLYTAQRLTITQIAAQLGCSEDLISRYLHRFKIVVRRAPGHFHKDITGQQFGHLTILGLSHIGESDWRAYWRCRCRCGNESVVSGKELRRKDRPTYSCGACPYLLSANMVVPKAFWTKAKQAARVRSLPFEITLDDLEELWLAQEGKCALSGLTLRLSHLNVGTASLDRIDSTGGYVLGNIQFVHVVVNLMKQNIQQDVFKAFCGLVAAKGDVQLDEQQIAAIECSTSFSLREFRKD